MEDFIKNGKITLKMLRYFLVVAEELHFGRAADNLNITQPPLSVKIKALESALNVPLFERNSRNVSLTQSGEQLKKDCESLFLILNKSLNQIQNHANKEKYRLRIGIISSALWEGFIDIIKRFKSQYPQYDYDFIELAPHYQMEALNENRIDIGICRYPDTLNIHPLAALRLIEEDMYLAVSVEHPLSSRKRVHLKELENESFTLLSKFNSKTTALIDEYCQKAGFHLHIAYEVTEPQTMLAFVAANQAISIVPESYAVTKSSQVRFIKLAETIPAGLYLIYDPLQDQQIINDIVTLAK